MPRKFTLEAFQRDVNHLNVKVIKYEGVDAECVYECIHGTNSTLGWTLKKAKHCCRTGYLESGAMWKKRTRTLEELRSKALQDRDNIDVTNTYLEKSGRFTKLSGILCIKHNITYSSFTGKKIGLCPECNKERNIEQLKAAAPIAWAKTREGVFVSKTETVWLDSLGVKERQVWLNDIGCKVDGFDSKTHTVYLYHGKFWHGCLETYKPETIHPIIGITMQELYNRTKEYESRITSAGYNLVVEWGT